jgi:hypothetical protein
MVEANWGIGTISTHAIDNLPNPVTSGDHYVPVNGASIRDLMTLFDFSRSHAQIDASRQRLLAVTAHAATVKAVAGGDRVTRAMR